jgi:type IV secretion system protein VirB10
MIRNSNKVSIVATLLLVVLAGNFDLLLAQKKSVKKKPVYYTVKVGHVMRVRLNSDLDSERARANDVFKSTLVDPVYSSGGVLLAPEGSTVSGLVTAVQRAAKNGKPATLDVRFTSITLPNGIRRSLNGSLTDLSDSGGKSDNEGTVSANKTSHRKAKFIGGGAAGGAVIGAIAGGGKGLAIGAGVGAITGAVAGRLKKGHEVKVKSGTEFGVILNQNIAFTKYAPR